MTTKIDSIFAAVKEFWIIGVNFAVGGTTPLGAVKLITPAWGAIVSLIVCGLGLVGSIFFGLGEKQRY